MIQILEVYVKLPNRGNCKQKLKEEVLKEGRQMEMSLYKEKEMLVFLSGCWLEEGEKRRARPYLARCWCW